MTPTEAAKFLGVNRLTVLRWVRTGRLAAEKVTTPHGPGYEIRLEDLQQAASAPRKKREVDPKPVAGSMVAAIEDLRQALDAQTRAIEDQRAEIHDLRGQLAQTEARLTEALRALPARTEPTEQPRRTWWPFGKNRQ